MAKSCGKNRWKAGSVAPDSIGRPKAVNGIRVYNPELDVTTYQVIAIVITQKGLIQPVREETIRAKLDRYEQHAARFSWVKLSRFTIAVWTRTTGSKGTLLSQRNSRDGGATIDILIADNDGHWHHLELTREGDSIELFPGGVSQGGKSGTLLGGAITTNLRARGAERYWLSPFAFDDQHFEGDVDEFCIFDCVLKANAIAALPKN